MKKAKRSGSSLFLLEIILNILIFSFLLCICLQIFVKARRLTIETTQLQRASTCCSNAASIYEAGDGSLESLVRVYTYSISINDQVIVYLDSDFTECTKGNAVYYMRICPLAQEESSSVKKVSVSCFDESEEIYSITACNYTPLTAQGGGSYE